MRYETANFRMRIIAGVHVDISVAGCQSDRDVMTVAQFSLAVRALKDLERAVRRVSKKYQEAVKEPV